MPQHEDASGSVAQFVQTRLRGLAAADQALVIGWLKAVQRRNRQPTTLKTYCGALKTFVHSWEGHRPASLLQVQRAHVERFLDHFQTRGLHPSTINAVLGCVHRFYAESVKI
jgi:site-specific recombinase XerD